MRFNELGLCADGTYSHETLVNNLKDLRADIVLNSLFIADYHNRFGLDQSITCDFFDGFMSYLQELEREDYGEDALTIEDFFDKYDTLDNLVEWYYMHEEFGDEVEA